MKLDNQDSAANDVDPQVSAQYRAVADESTPEKLNQAVLSNAATAAKKRAPGIWNGAWYRPAAFAATVGLSLALLLRLTETGVVNPPVATSLESGSESAAADTSPSGTATDMVEAPAVFGKYDDRSQAPASSPITDPIDAVRAAKEDLGDGSREPDNLSKASADAALSAARQAEEARQRVTAVSAAQPLATDEATGETMKRLDSETNPERCSDEQRSDAESWWQCVQEQRQSNRLEAAEMELDRLRTAFPDFEPRK